MKTMWQRCQAKLRHRIQLQGKKKWSRARRLPATSDMADGVTIRAGLARAVDVVMALLARVDARRATT